MDEIQYYDAHVLIDAIKIISLRFELKLSTISSLLGSGVIKRSGVLLAIQPNMTYRHLIPASVDRTSVKCQVIQTHMFKR